MRAVLLDGGLGSMLIAAGLEAGRAPEWWNFEHPERIEAVVDDPDLVVVKFGDSYDVEAATIAEKYHILVIADFPVNFSETAGRNVLGVGTTRTGWVGAWAVRAFTVRSLMPRRVPT